MSLKKKKIPKNLFLSKATSNNITRNNELVSLHVCKYTQTHTRTQTRTNTHTYPKIKGFMPSGFESDGLFLQPSQSSLFLCVLHEVHLPFEGTE